MKNILKLMVGFFTKKWVKWAVVGVLLFLAVLFAVLHNKKCKEVKQLHTQVEAAAAQVEAQCATIDSLNGRQMHTINIALTVTDRSRAVIRGAKNKGTITMPNDKTYRIELDSISIINAFK